LATNSEEKYMLIITAATIIALALAYFTLRKTNQHDPAQLAQPRASLLTIGVQIICGDCSGSDDRPVKTYLDIHGNCSQCGGHSYILASNRAVYAQQLIATRMADQQSAMSNGRVLPFESPAMRVARAEKIAV
jgi:hypothetical protein